MFFSTTTTTTTETQHIVGLAGVRQWHQEQQDTTEPRSVKEGVVLI